MEQSDGAAVPATKRKTLKRLVNRIRGRTLASAEPGEFLVAKDKVLGMEHELERTLNSVRGNQSLVKQMYLDLAKSNTSGDEELLSCFSAQAKVLLAHHDLCQTLVVDSITRKLALVQEIKRKCKDELDFAHLQLEDARAKLAAEQAQPSKQLPKVREKFTRYQQDYDALSNSLLTVLDQILEDAAASASGTALGFIREECVYFKVLQAELYRAMWQTAHNQLGYASKADELEGAPTIDVWEEFRQRCLHRHASTMTSAPPQAASASSASLGFKCLDSPVAGPLSAGNSNKPPVPQLKLSQATTSSSTSSVLSTASAPSTLITTTTTPAAAVTPKLSTAPRFDLKRRPGGGGGSLTQLGAPPALAELGNRMFSFKPKAGAAAASSAPPTSEVDGDSRVAAVPVVAAAAAATAVVLSPAASSLSTQLDSADDGMYLQQQDAEFEDISAEFPVYEEEEQQEEEYSVFEEQYLEMAAFHEPPQQQQEEEVVEYSMLEVHDDATTDHQQQHAPAVEEEDIVLESFMDMEEEMPAAPEFDAIELEAEEEFVVELEEMQHEEVEPLALLATAAHDPPLSSLPRPSALTTTTAAAATAVLVSPRTEQRQQDERVRQQQERLRLQQLQQQQRQQEQLELQQKLLRQQQRHEEQQRLQRETEKLLQQEQQAQQEKLKQQQLIQQQRQRELAERQRTSVQRSTLLPPPVTPPAASKQPAYPQRVLAVHDFAAEQPGDLAFKSGHELVITKPATDAGWFHAKSLATGQQGLVPFDGFLKPVAAMPAPPVLKTRPPASPQAKAVQPQSQSQPQQLRAKYAFAKEQPGDLAVQPGDLLVCVGAGPSPEWMLAQNVATGQRGLVPKDFCEAVAKPKQPPPSPAATAALATFVVIEPFTKQQPGDLSVRRGEVVELVECQSADWVVVRNARGEQGLAPLSFLRADMDAV